MIKGKRILLGISGGIAAFKAPLLLRLLIREGAQVRVVATENALEFVTITTLETLSGFPVYVNMFPKGIQRNTEHIEITDWADAMIVAPATANIIGKLASGIADDALSTTLLAFDKLLVLAPAMNTKMWAHPSVESNISLLSKRGVQFAMPDEGMLACGYDGRGRMQEPEALLEYLKQLFRKQADLAGMNVLVSAGPTHEAIDPVRFIGNNSSGKMGFAIAEAFAARGANVTLVAGPVALSVANQAINRVDVVSADQMNDACIKHFRDAQITVMAAAVADFTIVDPATSKIKKGKTDSMSLKMVPTIDVLFGLGKLKSDRQVLIGFALETDNELQNASAKLKSKNLDMIVMNSLNDKGSGFGTDTNKVTFVFSANQKKSLPLQSKIEVADQLVDAALTIYLKKAK